MPKHAQKPACSPEDRKTLQAWSASQTMEVRLVTRAKIILLCLDRMQDIEVAKRLQTRPNTVGKWRMRFINQGLGGLRDLPRPGQAPKYDPKKTRDNILALLGTNPPKGQAVWDGPAVAKALKISTHQVWRILRKERICLKRQRSWCVSTDKEFAAKAADVVGLYLNPPENALVISVDEKPSIQALERATGYVETDSGKIVRGLKSTYKRHGTVNLFAALEVATGAVRGKFTEQKRRVEFLEFMDGIVADLPAGREIHVILDNYCIHKRNDPWLLAHPKVFFHFTPTSASWLNMVEIWFGIMSRKALRGASFKSTTELRQAIEDFIEVYNPQARPFVWRKREVKGSQLRNTIANLRN